MIRRTLATKAIPPRAPRPAFQKNPAAFTIAALHARSSVQDNALSGHAMP